MKKGSAAGRMAGGAALAGTKNEARLEEDPGPACVRGLRVTTIQADPPDGGRERRSATLGRVRRALYAIGALVLLAALVGGLMQAGGGDPAPAGERLHSPEASRAALAGAPPPLAAVYSQPSEILDGGRKTFRARLRELRGHPVVINKWASWCGPCRAEFPHLNRQAVANGKRVAFLGLNTADNRGEAAAFLREMPLPFPSYSDPDAEIARELGIEVNFPTTILLDERGKVAFVHQGQYRTEEDLAEEIERYLG